MPDLPRQIRLAAGDYFMHAQDRAMRRSGLPGNNCCAVIHLANGFDLERLRRRIDESSITNWLARARMVRPLFFLPPVWRTSETPKKIFFEHNSEIKMETPWSPPPEIAQHKLRAEDGPGVTFDVLRHADGTSHLFLSWNHTLLDAQGLDLLLNHLNAERDEWRVASDEKTSRSPETDSRHSPPVTRHPSNAPGVADFISPKQNQKMTLTRWWANAQVAHTSMKWLDESGKEPLFTPAPSDPRDASRLNHRRRVVFTEDETARIDERGQKIAAGFRRSHFYLAASLRALHTLALQRGNQDGAYLIPVPHDTRRHGAKGPIFSNHLSILFYRVEARFAGKIRDIVGELGRQMTNQIRDRFPEACMAALELFKPIPPGYYVRHLGKPTRGKIASLSFSDSGEACPGMTEFCGGKILDVTHTIPCWRSPGVTALFLRFGKKLSVMLSWVDDCMSQTEADNFERDMRRALLEEEL